MTEVPRWLRKQPGSLRSASGLEWALWRRLPAIWLWGTALCAAAAAVVWWLQPDIASAAHDRVLWLWLYRIAGLALLHTTLVFTVAIGCAVVLIMKGPAYCADPLAVDAEGHDSQAHGAKTAATAVAPAQARPSDPSAADRGPQA